MKSLSRYIFSYLCSTLIINKTLYTPTSTMGIHFIEYNFFVLTTFLVWFGSIIIRFKSNQIFVTWNSFNNALRDTIYWSWKYAFIFVYGYLCKKVNFEKKLYFENSILTNLKTNYPTNYIENYYRVITKINIIKSKTSK